MKDLLRQAFSPILENFQNDAQEYHYKTSHRVILLAMSVMFFILSSTVGYMAYDSDSPGYYIPTVIFGLVSLVTLIVGALGTEQEVANIWGNKK